MSRLHQLCGGEPAALLFDLDGTLIDSVPDLAVALNRTREGLGYASVAEEKVRLWLGNGARRLLQRALADARGEAEDAVPDSAVDEALPRFFDAYESACTVHTRVYPGVFEALDGWREAGLAMACVTNKPLRFTERILAHFGLDGYMPIALGGDSLPEKKPHPAPLLEACKRLGRPVTRAVMIGDSHNDVLAARRADMAVVAVTYGYNYGRCIAEESPDLLVDRLDQLL